MLSPLEISDRLEIQATLALYADAVDRHQLDLLDQVFTADADLDYTEITPYRGDLAYTKEWLKVMPEPRSYYHLMALGTITVTGDTAQTRTPCFNPMPAADGLSLYGHWYRDRWVRTDEGWRICERFFEVCYHASVARA